MIPVEYLWGTLILVLGIIGMVRGLWKELGVTAVILLSLFVLKFGWDEIGSRIVGAVGSKMPESYVMALYYTISISFVAFLSLIHI